jgi:hypothetical protein
MQITTAIKVLHEECKFLGVNIEELLWDIKRQGRMVYSTKVVEAATVFELAGGKVLA